MITSEQIRGARAMLRIEQSELAAMAQVSLETIERIERQSGPVLASAGTLDTIQEALESAGVEFIEENGGRVGLRLRMASPRGGEKTTPAPYRAARVCGQGTLDEWNGRASDDESAAHRLGQHLKSKIEQGATGYSPDDMVTLTRPDGEIITVARAREFVERLKGWKTSPTAAPDLDSE
jgi:transcriptional regulator with XRE-family HTH domain